MTLYRWTLSPAKTFLFGPHGQCRFDPSCSAYAIEAVRTHGAVAGGWMGLKRICRCHPWGGCGHDPVPSRRSPGHDASNARPAQEPPPPAPGWFRPADEAHSR